MKLKTNYKLKGGSAGLKFYDVIRKKSFWVLASDVSVAGTEALQNFQDDYYIDQRWMRAYPGTPDNQKEVPFRYLVLKPCATKRAPIYKVRPCDIGIHTDKNGFCNDFHKRIVFMVSLKTLKNFGFNPQ